MYRDDIFMTVGLIAGFVLVGIVGYSWKSAVLSGDYFSVGQQFYTCHKVQLHE